MRNLSILAAAALLASACGSDPRTVTDADVDVARVASENNAFTLDIYDEIADAEEGNLFLSPFSMNAALSMTYAGARGDTAAEMEQVLHMEAGADHHGPLGAMLRDLSGDYRRDYQLRTANRIWGQEGQAWQQDFLDITREDYGAETVLTDIYADPEGTRQEINAWVADQTEDRIDELLPQGSIDGSPMVLVNAIYFKADWTVAFDKKDTTTDAFTRVDGSTVNVDRMHATDLPDVKWADAEGYTLAGLPYGKGADLRLWIVLPDTHDGLADVVDGLDAAALDTLMDEAPAGEAAIALPKLELRTEARLKQPLSNLGMPLAFTPSADFSGMREGGGLMIDEVYHEAFVLMDEKGTEAAAATAVVMRDTLAEEDPRYLDVSHPYLFLIRDELTGAVLFIGRVADPSLDGPA